MARRVTFLFVLLSLSLSLLYIQSEGSTRNLKLETISSAKYKEVQRASVDVQTSGTKNSSLGDGSDILGTKIGDNIVSYSAIYELAGGAYFGGGGRFDIYGVSNLTEGEIVTTAVWIVGVQDGNMEVIQAGWHVNPALYHDSATRFFTRWTADGYISTGCYNMLCEGFVRVGNAPVSPGDVLPISNPDAHHELRIWIEKDHTGDWWLYASTESTTGQVGYWPNSLFSQLAQSATGVNFGGLVQAMEGSPSPPMGSGHFPSEEGSAALFANVEYADQSGRKIAGILPSVVTNKGCYDVGNLNDARFAYGGPGGCNRR